MTKRIFPLALLAACFLCITCDDDQGNEAQISLDECMPSRSSSAGKPVEGRYIVSFPAGRAEGGGSRVFRRHGIAGRAVVDKIQGESEHYVLDITNAQARALESDSSVISIEQDRVIAICACFSVVEPRTMTWNIDRVGYGDGTGKTAWVMDTGIDADHPDLIVDARRSRSFVDGIASAADDNGHGTHVAGIIGGKNNREGVVGIASGASIVSLKILDKDGEGRLSWALKALAYLRIHARPGDAVNLSMGLDEKSELLESEIRALAGRGIYFAIAAGNEKALADDFSPARTGGPNVYTVSAIDSLNRFARFSNYGSVVDFAAPGVRILSSYKNGGYAVMSGTSMAAPHVAGLLLITGGKLKSDGFASGDPDGRPDPVAHR